MPFCITWLHIRIDFIDILLMILSPFAHFYFDIFFWCFLFLRQYFEIFLLQTIISNHLIRK